MRPDEIYPMAEWQAWRIVCKELGKRGIDVNAPEHDILVRAIRHYSATYHQLFPVDEFHAQASPDRVAVEPLIQALR